MKRAADGRSQKSMKIINEGIQGQKQILAEHLDGLKRNNFATSRVLDLSSQEKVANWPLRALPTV